MTLDPAQKEVLASIFGILVKRRGEIIEEISSLPDYDDIYQINAARRAIRMHHMSEVERIILAIGEMYGDDLTDEQKDTIACILGSIELRKQEAGE